VRLALHQFLEANKSTLTLFIYDDCCLNNDALNKRLEFGVVIHFCSRCVFPDGSNIPIS